MKIDDKRDQKEIDGESRTRAFAMTASEACRFLRLMNISRDHAGDHNLVILWWDILGRLRE
jgi:hypothetical protein